MITIVECDMGELKRSSKLVCIAVNKGERLDVQFREVGCDLVYEFHWELEKWEGGCDGLFNNAVKG